MMLQWDLYSKFTPQFNGSEKLYNRDFPWYNSTQLKALYPDKNELRVALFKLFFLPETTYSMKEGKRVFGVKAVETSLKEAMEEYETIARLYPNGKVPWMVKGVYPGDEVDPRLVYYGWLGDRRNHGLKNTVDEFTGFFDNSPGYDEFLTRNWKYWDLVKFIIGYERWNRAASEVEDIPYIMPAVLRMAGFPTSVVGIKPAPLGSGGVEWAVGLPPYIIDRMKREFPNSNILFGPGYTFGLFSCGDGLVKERGIDEHHKPIENGITRVFERIEELIYFMKRD